MHDACAAAVPCHVGQCHKAMNACVNICSAAVLIYLARIAEKILLSIARLQEHRCSRLSRLGNGIAVRPDQPTSLRLSPCRSPRSSLRDIISIIQHLIIISSSCIQLQKHRGLYSSRNTMIGRKLILSGCRDVQSTDIRVTHLFGWFLPRRGVARPTSPTRPIYSISYESVCE